MFKKSDFYHKGNEVNLTVTQLISAADDTEASYLPFREATFCSTTNQYQSPSASQEHPVASAFFPP
ncbi:hypothetical protein SARI_04634 [Salmonella enterica subsp. arizonae serovar 62:z4,z23:-]|uniref:Uncharacterized protein n=1 Tax=Salmonella arizonae (strain ATCC BAA-731 / CDC346-86 / RSK2980) TaxID=41514 RepID=A9MRK6_SALAR|nr:hypothetical protein SARI_04634 [Salmonella enterica subsp. arizonae serovar 62:z4,z23:-]